MLNSILPIYRYLFFLLFIKFTINVDMSLYFILIHIYNSLDISKQFLSLKYNFAN